MQLHTYIINLSFPNELSYRKIFALLQVLTEWSRLAVAVESLHSVFNAHPTTFCLLWSLISSANQQNCSPVFPTEIPYRTEDDQCKHLQQTATATDRRIRFFKHNRNGLRILPAWLKMIARVFLSVSLAGWW